MMSIYKSIYVNKLIVFSASPQLAQLDWHDKLLFWKRNREVHVKFLKRENKYRSQSKRNTGWMSLCPDKSLLLKTAAHPTWRRCCAVIIMKSLALILLFQIYGQSLSQNATRPNIVMVMSDAFVSMN